MNNLNVPIYRAKKIDSDEYVFGKLIEDYSICFYLQINKSLENICNTYGDYGFSTTDFEEIDITTLSIHFSDMLDSQGSKIFASLSKDGKGGDRLRIQQLDEDEPFEDRTVLYNETSIHIKNIELGHYCHLDMINLEFANIIGVQE